MRTTALLIACCLLEIASRAPAQTTSSAPTTSDDAVDLVSTQRVTLHLKSAMPGAAVAAIAARAGAHMELFVPVAGPHLLPYPVYPHDFDADNEPLVLAVLRLETTYDLGQSKRYGEDGVVFIKRAPGDNPFATPQPASTHTPLPPACITGPFGVIASQITDERWCDPLPVPSPVNAVPPPAQQSAQPNPDFQPLLVAMPLAPLPPFFAGPPILLSAADDIILPNSDNSRPIETPQPAAGASVVVPEVQHRLQLRLVVTAEPRITVLGISPLPTVDTMIDDQGEPLWDPPQGQAPMSDPEYDNGQDNAALLDLRDPVAAATNIVSLKGSFQLHVVTRSHPYEWHHLDQPGPHTQVISGLRVTLESLQDDAGTPTQQAIININRNGTDQRDWMGRQLLIGHGSHIQIFDKSGKLISDPFRWYSVTNGMQLQIALPAHANPDHTIALARPFRMTWDFPLDAGDVRVPFAFNHLPLPKQ